MRLGRVCLRVCTCGRGSGRSGGAESAAAWGLLLSLVRIPGLATISVASTSFVVGRVRSACHVSGQVKFYSLFEKGCLESVRRGVSREKMLFVPGWQPLSKDHVAPEDVLCTLDDSKRLVIQTVPVAVSMEDDAALLWHDGRDEMAIVVIKDRLSPLCRGQVE